MFINAGTEDPELEERRGRLEAPIKQARRLDCIAAVGLALASQKADYR